MPNIKYLSLLKQKNCKTKNHKNPTKMNFKHIFTALLITTCATQLSAQNNTTTLRLDAPQPRAAIKLNLYNTMFGAFSPNAEVKLTPKISLNLGYTIKKISASNLSSIVDGFALSLPDTVSFNSAFSPLKTRTFVPELRFYVGKKGAMQGFYIAPYARFLRGSSTLNVTTTNNKTYDGTMNLKANRGGIMLGYQWIISNHFVIDWGIGALQYSRYNLSVRAGSIPQADYAQVITEINKFIDQNASLNLPKIDPNLGYNQIFDNQGYFTLNPKINTPGFRSTLSIGYNF
jgi:hypothetical protein